MKPIFCTLFDSFYLTRGLALLKSLEQRLPDFELYIFAFDELSEEILKNLNHAKVRVVSLKNFETEALLKVKASRSKGEYCWTSTPLVIEHTLNISRAEIVTYLDADLFFFSDPIPFLKQFKDSGNDVLITPHHYFPAYDQTATSGFYCVQFMSFRNTDNGRKILSWWRDRCLEWCFARFEDGKFGDQKYLDDWTSRFSGVYVENSKSIGVAPWNLRSYKLETGPSVDGQPIVFYHFHGLRFYRSGRIDPCEASYYLPPLSAELIYKPYCRNLSEQFKYLESLNSSYDFGKVNEPTGILNILRRFRRRFIKRLWLLHEA